MKKTEIRKVVRRALFENLEQDQSVSMDRIAILNKYLDKRLSEFNSKVRKIVLEHNHPYINAYLKKALIELEETINKGEYQILGWEEFFLQE